jgi:hypothetical protein
MRLQDFLRNRQKPQKDNNHAGCLIGIHSECLTGYGLEIVERVPIEMAVHEDNKDYLKAKQEKLGHLLEVVWDVIR